MLGALRHEQGLVHAIEVLDHVGVRLAPVVLAHAGDEVAVTHAETEEEAIGEGLGERLLPCHHRHGVTRIDVVDARGERERRGGPEQDRRRHEWVAANCLCKPQSAVAELLKDLCGTACLGCREGVDAPVPNADLADIDAGQAHGKSFRGGVPTRAPAQCERCWWESLSRLRVSPAEIHAGRRKSLLRTQGDQR